jgi:hypothetical protein
MASCRSLLLDSSVEALTSRPQHVVLVKDTHTADQTLKVRCWLPSRPGCPDHTLTRFLLRRRRSHTARSCPRRCWRTAMAASSPSPSASSTCGASSAASSRCAPGSLAAQELARAAGLPPGCGRRCCSRPAAASCPQELDDLPALIGAKMLQRMRMLEERGAAWASRPLKELGVVGGCRLQGPW